MRMLRWILGLTLRDKNRNDDIRRILGVAFIMDKVREARLRWFGHVQCREEEDCVRRILEADCKLYKNGNTACMLRYTHIPVASLQCFAYCASA